MNSRMPVTAISHHRSHATFQVMVLADDGEAIAWSDNSFFEDAKAEEDFIFMVSYAEGRAKVKFVDNNTDGMSRIELDSDSKPAIYTINGTKD